MSFFLFLSYLSFFSHFLLHSCHASLLFPFSKSLVSKFLPSVHLSHFMSNFPFLLSTHQFLFVNVLSSLHYLPFVSILCFHRWFPHLQFSPFLPSFSHYLSTLNVLSFPPAFFLPFKNVHTEKRERGKWERQITDAFHYLPGCVLNPNTYFFLSVAVY